MSKVAKTAHLAMLAALVTAALSLETPAAAQIEPRTEPWPFFDTETSERLERARETPFGRALAEAVANPQSTARVHLYTRCLTGERYEQMEFFGNGVTIWNNESQFVSPPLARAGLLRLLLTSGFAEMPDVFGAEQEEGDASDQQEAPLRILCEVEATIGGQTKRVEQHDRGARSGDLDTLAHTLLDTSRLRGRMLGVAADDLGDGLAKVAAGDLAPETLRLIFHRKPEAAGPEARGVLLRLRGSEMTVQAWRQNSGFDQPVRTELESPVFQRLAGQLSARGFAQLPLNVYSEDYIDLTVEILGHRRSIQARQFAGMSPETDREASYELAKIVSVIEGLSAPAATRAPDDQPISEG